MRNTSWFYSHSRSFSPNMLDGKIKNPIFSILGVYFSGRWKHQSVACEVLSFLFFVESSSHEQLQLILSLAFHTGGFYYKESLLFHGWVCNITILLFYMHKIHWKSKKNVYNLYFKKQIFFWQFNLVVWDDKFISFTKV